MAIARIIEHVILDRILTGNVSFANQNKLGQGLMAVSGFFVFLSLCFGIYAGHLWLQDNYSPDKAAALTALLCFTTGLVLLLGSLATVHYKAKRLKSLTAEIRTAIHDVIDFLDEELTDPVQENPKTAAVIASMAGYVAGNKFL